MEKLAKNWLDAHREVCETIQKTLPKKQARQVISEIESGVIRLVLKLMGFEEVPENGKITKEIKAKAYDFMATLPLKKLIVALKRFEEHLPQSGLSSYSQNTYGGRVRGWFEALHAHGYWPGRYMSAEMANQCSPFTRYGYGPVKDVRVTQRQGRRLEYALKPKDLPPRARQWYETTSGFLSKPNQPGRVFGRMETETVKTYQRVWLQIWGWQVGYNGVPLAEIGPEHLCPVVDLNDFEALPQSQQNLFWRKQIRALEEILCGHHDFLLQVAEGRSPYTWITKLCGIHTAARVLYKDWVDREADYAQIPIIKRLYAAFDENREQMKEWQKSPEVAGLKEKWPDVPIGSTALEVFQQQVLEPMRLECLPRTSNGHPKSPRRVAHRYQQFLRVAFVGWLPPLRQQVDRELKVALSCPVERPKFVPPEGHYYPLPPNDVRDLDYRGQPQDNYLYRTYVLNGRPYPEGVWVREVRSQKTSKSMGTHITILPNRQFRDGSNLYQYLEAYLEVVWWPLRRGRPYTGQDPRFQNTLGKWVTPGRSRFQPEDLCARDREGYLWSFGILFVSPKTGRPYSRETYGYAIRDNSARMIGKPITPHTTRYFWASWGIQIGLTDAELRSLAFMMGHSVETLRNMYAKVTPLEHQELIEEAIIARLSLPDGDADKLPLNKMLRASHHLTPEEQQQLMRHLRKLMEEGNGGGPIKPA